MNQTYHRLQAELLVIDQELTIQAQALRGKRQALDEALARLRMRRLDALLELEHHLWQAQGMRETCFTRRDRSYWDQQVSWLSHQRMQLQGEIDRNDPPRETPGEQQLRREVETLQRLMHTQTVRRRVLLSQMDVLRTASPTPPVAPQHPRRNKRRRKPQPKP